MTTKAVSQASTPAPSQRPSSRASSGSPFSATSSSSTTSRTSRVSSRRPRKQPQPRPGVWSTYKPAVRRGRSRTVVPSTQRSRAGTRRRHHRSPTPREETTNRLKFVQVAADARFSMEAIENAFAGHGRLTLLPSQIHTATSWWVVSTMDSQPAFRVYHSPSGAFNVRRPESRRKPQTWQHEPCDEAMDYAEVKR